MAAKKTNAPKQGRWGLKGKLILSMLLVGVIPLLVGLAMAFYVGFEEIRQVSGTNFEAIATETARKLDLVLGEEIARAGRLASNSLIIGALERRRDQDLSDEDRQALIARTAEAWKEQDLLLLESVTQGPLADVLRRHYTGAAADPSQHIPVVARAAKRALFITDIYGTLVASLHPEAPYSSAHEAWWQGTYNNGVGKPFIENVHFDERFGVYVFSLSLPVMDSIRYEAIGVVHQVYDAKEFLAPSIHPIRFGKTGHVMLIDSQGTVVTCPILPTGTRLSDTRVIPLVTKDQPNWVAAPSDGHGDQRTSLLGRFAGSIIGFSPLPAISRITRDSTGLAWHTFVWQSSDELFAPVQQFLSRISVFGLVAVGLLVTLGYMAGGRIVTPIRRLQEAALLIGRGELKEPITIKTGDEIEDLADEINRMNTQLEAAFAGLTTQVQQKTQEVQELQRSTDTILDSVSTPILMLDDEACVHYINRAARETLSLVERNGEPANLFELLRLDESSQEQLRCELEALIQRVTEGSTATQAADVLAPCVQVRDPLSPQQASDSAQQRREIEINGSVYRYEWFEIGARRQERQQIGLILRDMTEESRRQDKLIEAEKSGSMGVLAAGIGHELNNPLFSILGLGEAIQDETDFGKVKSYAKDILSHAKRMATTVRDFTGVARADSKERRVQVDINDQLEQVLKLLPLADETSALKIYKTFQPLPKISAVPDELRQVFVNVLTNAVQAMKYEGTLYLSTQMSDNTIRVQIQDTGPGIPKAYLSKVFDPFFTTKKQGEGSGLGLTVANRIVNKYDGRIQLESREGKGTTCTITFPLPESS